MNLTLQQAVQVGEFSTVRKLLADNANVNSRDKYGNTSLYWAITRIAASYSIDDVTRLILLLIDKGADVNAVNLNNQTPLHWAAMYGHKEILELLINKRANINAADSNGQTPLSWAIKSGYTRIADFLRTYGAEEK